MLHVVVRSEGREQVLDHPSGPLEFGRGEAHEGVPRCFLSDPFVSRDQLRVELTGAGAVRIENLSHGTAVLFEGGPPILPGEGSEARLPVRLHVGESEVLLSAVAERGPEPPGVADPYSPETVTAAATPRRATITLGDGDPTGPRIESVPSPWLAGEERVALHKLGATPDAETLAHWFQTLVTVQQAAATSTEFLEATARAVVDLVGLDRGLVLQRSGERWVATACFPPAIPGRSQFSSTVLDEVLRRKQTVYRNFGSDFSSLSLVGVDTVVAAPVLDAAHDIVGVVYGARSLQPDRPPPRIAPLEALVVQVLAAAVGAGLQREQEQEKAFRSQLRFEQFFSPQLANELAADPSLLEGREREVTVLFTDVRNFSRISEHLGPRRTFDMMQDVMDLQSEQVRLTEGVVVDYVGDGLLAIWNAPADQAGHPALACRTAVAFLQQLPALSARWEPEAGEPIRLGVGIHTGTALVGNTGSRVKFKYGPMGPSVNLASRLENATKYLGVSPLLTRATRDRLPPAFATRRLGTIRVQGFANPIDVYELFVGEPAPGWRRMREQYELALGHFEQREWSEACSILASLLAAGHDYDVPSLQLLSRSVECLRSRPDAFDPSFDIHKQS